MPDYNLNPLFAGIAQGFKATEDAAEEYKSRAREFKALQEFADATGMADKDRTTTMDLESLRGFVRGAEAKRANAEREQAMALRQQAAKLSQDQFAEQLRGNRVREDLDWRRLMSAEGQRSVDNVRALDADRRAEADFALRQRTGTFTLGQAEQEAAALTGFARDFSGYAGEDFAPTQGRGMLLPMTDLQRRDLALQRNPGAFASDRFDTNATALMRFAPKPADGWGLKPGQPVPLPGGGLGFATTPNSIQGPPKVEAARFAQPELSKDGKFYRSGPDDNWHPVSQGNPLLEAILAQGGLRPGSLPVMPAAAAPKPTLKFNPKTGFVD